MGLDSDGAEKNRAYDQWIRLLIAPGGSLGGARPKASVIGENGLPWFTLRFWRFGIAVRS